MLPAPEESNTRHGRLLYTVLVDLDAVTASRYDIVAALHRQRIGTGVHYRGVHRHSYFRERFALRPGDYPVADRISDQTLSLPLGPALSDEDVSDVISALRRTLDYFRRPR
ncbi:MAG: DegT/DnrJ/EryC1/StrS family aminotransferase [Actinomycetota bacterium]|nr:DegT/DnrJ/EryC1/StrS family aminotransferase [Actinomycetota bacterium]